MKPIDIAKANKDIGVGYVAAAIIFILFSYFFYKITDSYVESNKELLRSNKELLETNSEFVKVLNKMDKRLSRIEGYMFVKPIKINENETVYEIVPLGD